jgi:hypothetical protein
MRFLAADHVRKGSRLGVGEGEVCDTDVDDLSGSPETGEWDRGLASTGEDEVGMGRKGADEVC